MRFYEYEAKALLRKNGVPTSKGDAARTPDDAVRIAATIDGEVVLKSQVLTGGRMKAGGIQFASSPDDVRKHAGDILNLVINDQAPRAVLVEAKSAVKKEYYAGVIYDGNAKLPVAIFSDMGGIDIEEVAEKHPEHVARVHFSTFQPLQEFKFKELVASLGISGNELNQLSRIVSRLAKTFLAHGLTLAEINPLAQLDDGTFIALDSHMDMEDEARDQQRAVLDELGIGPDESRQAREPTAFENRVAQVDAEDHRGVVRVVEFDGNLGCVIGAGGGSLTIFDALRKHGGRPANYCEIGGNPSVHKAQEVTKAILAQPGVEKICVIMNVVSNTRVDIVARGVIKGCVESGRDPADTIAIFRIPGSWEADGFKILEKYGVEYADRTVPMSEAARRAVVKLAGGAK